MIRFIHECGLSGLIYDINFFASLLPASAVAFFFGRRMKIKSVTAALCVPLVWLLSYLSACLVMYAETDFATFNCGYNIRGFVFIPFAVWLASAIFGVNYSRIADLIAPLFCIQHALANIGCIFYGCCYGYPSKMGIYSPITGDLRFPVQMIEMIFSLLLSGAIFLVIKKRRYNTGGVALFLSLSIFAVGRFFLEFLKDSDKRLLGFLHPLQLHMLFLLSVCIISLAYIHLLKREKAARRKSKAGKMKKNAKIKK